MKLLKSKIKSLFSTVKKSMKRLAVKSAILISDVRGGDGAFGFVIGVVIVFAVGALLLLLMTTVFGDTAIGGWLKNTVGTWFPTGGEQRPTA